MKEKKNMKKTTRRQSLKIDWEDLRKKVQEDEDRDIEVFLTFMKLALKDAKKGGIIYFDKINIVPEVPNGASR